MSGVQTTSAGSFSNRVWLALICLWLGVLLLQNAIVASVSLKATISYLELDGALGAAAAPFALVLIGALINLAIMFVALTGLLLVKRAWSVVLTIVAVWLGCGLTYAATDQIAWLAIGFEPTTDAATRLLSNPLGVLVAVCATYYLLTSSAANIRYGLRTREAWLTRGPIIWRKLRSRSPLND